MLRAGSTDKEAGRFQGPASQTFLAFGSGNNPRWLIPAGRCGMEAALRSWSPYRASSKMAWGVVKAALRWGGVARLLATETVRADWIESVNWRKLGWSKEAEPVALVYLGTPGERRKAVFHLVDPESGLCELVVKVPLTACAVQAVLHEAEVLTKLEAEGFEAAPRIVRVDRRRGIAAQTVIRGQVFGTELTRNVWRLLESLVLPQKTTTLGTAAAQMQAKLAQGCLQTREREALNAAVQRMADAAELPVCWVHGDFAPWNVKAREDGSLVLIDWEDAYRGGLPLQDAFHFLHQQQYLFGRGAQAAFERVHEFARFQGFGRELCQKLELAYLVESYLRQRSRSDHRHAGFLLATLTELLKGRVPAQRMRSMSCQPVLSQ